MYQKEKFLDANFFQIIRYHNLPYLLFAFVLGVFITFCDAALEIEIEIYNYTAPYVYS